MHEHFQIQLNGEKLDIAVPEEVKEVTPSLPLGNNVNEVKFQIARLYTALHIEVQYTCNF